MSHEFFNRGTQQAQETTPEPKPMEFGPKPEPTPTLKPVSEPKPNSTDPGAKGNLNSILSSWNEPTENPSDRLTSTPKKPKAEQPPTSEPPKPETPQPQTDQFQLDEKSRDSFAEALADINIGLMSSLIDWLNGPEANRFSGVSRDQKGNIKTAWDLILRKLRWKPSAWDALMSSNAAAFGKAFITAIFVFWARLMKGLVVWPWQQFRKLRKRTTQKPASEKQPGKKEPAAQKETTPPANSEPKICLQTGLPFDGAGYPKNPKRNKHLKGRFKDATAYRQYCNINGLSGPKKRKSQK
jgi:hypothetical protein